ncbi:MAG: polyprenyl synthetase family protein [Bacteroidales bacterium]|jgi:octaprenyl-diphosphate synthase|nr:polyprenyl synthetase family protein [Bacteroidales bacterium]
MISLNEIKAPVARHIEEFEKKFRDSMRTSVPLLDRITTYLVKRKGKQIRPLFVFLTAETCGGVNETTYRAASLIELLHTATLIHDDVVDDSNERRGFFSLNALWKNKVSVLVGDFLLSKGLLLSLDNNDFELLRIVSDATREMSEGELLQIEKARRLDIEEDVYFEIIRKKTASLIASCCASGAASAGADKETVRNMHRFGELTGIAFQIKDDLFDYSKSLETGKPNGIDIKEKKMTLPLIHLLSNSGWMEKRRIINIVKNHNDNPEKVAGLINQVNESGGIAYAEKRMLEYRDKALQMLRSFEPGESVKSLENLVVFTTERRS